jgi:hypothetical protein
VYRMSFPGVAKIQLSPIRAHEQPCQSHFQQRIPYIEAWRSSNCSVKIIHNMYIFDLHISCYFEIQFVCDPILIQ